MVQPSFASAAWYRALTLRERLPAPPASPDGIPPSPERARHRLDQWRAQPPFATDGYFPQRLTADGLGEDDLLHLLGESADSLRQRLEPPDWLAELARAFATSGPGPLPPSAAAPGPQPLAGFLEALQPLLQPAHDCLCRGCDSLLLPYPQAPFDPDVVIHLLWAGVPERLLRRVARTLVLELHVARLQGRLHGATSEERFQNFLGGYRQPEQLLALLQEYPVLARELARTLDRAVAFGLEFLQHLCADADTLRTHFREGGDLGMLTEVRGDGDAHRGGRSVRIVTFSSGLRLVYKPRSLAVEVRFQELLAWLNQRGDHPPFRTLKVLDRGSHGWSEWAAAEACHTVAEVQRFYEQLGGLVAVLYGLAAADMHQENLIAAGEHPVLVDLEALFQPEVHTLDLTHADHSAARALWESVMGTMLLPCRLSVAANGEGVDLSGLARSEGQQTPYPVPQWRDEGTDAMRLERTHKTLSGSKNCPTLNGAAVAPLDYQESLLTGFTSTYDLLARHRDELLAATGPLAGFADAEVRVILRSTRTYAVLLRESFHPDVLRDALDRDRLWDRLWATVPGNSRLAQVIPFERADLEQGDIPLFTTSPASRHLWSSGGARLPDFLAESGLERAQRCLCRLGPADRSRQLWFLRASLATLADPAPRRPAPSAAPTPGDRPAGRDQLLAAARAVGDRLGELAVLGAEDASWIGMVRAGSRHWNLAPLGSDLYDGLPGVALFLAHLGVVTSEERYTLLARRAVRTLQRHLEHAAEQVTSIGAFSGWGGILYTLAHLAALWQQPELRQQADTLVDRLPALIERDEALDLLGGAAGCIGALLGMERDGPSPRVRAAAVQCGDRLLACARRLPAGLGWVKDETDQPLTGFSHGAAGFAWALLHLAARTGEDRFRSAALDALAYERSQFVPAAGNWRDLRRDLPTEQPGGERPACLSAWCHGAPGIGLARLGSMPHLDDATARAEIATALATTLAQGFGGNHSLCHGDLGNLELFLQAHAVLGEPHWRAEAERVAGGILADIEGRGWQCGHGSTVETPGLMTGLAGIGYGLLRVAEAECVPAVLVLAPPGPRVGEW